jgi:hypothetical protein
MAVPVNLYVNDSTPSAAPIAGVTVGVYDPSDMSQVTIGTSDTDGIVSLLLPGSVEGTSYEVRFFKTGYVFSNPRLLIIYEPEDPVAPNGFGVVGTQFGVFNAPLDPRVCRCVGRFLNYQNQPVANAMVRLTTDADLRKKTPKIVDGNAISSSSMEARTDQNGFVVLDLLRTGEYFITFSGEDDETWNFKVPDRPSANLFDLIHPYPISLTWGEGVDTLSVALGATVLLPVSVLFSDFVSRSKDLHDIISFTPSDQIIADTMYIGHEGALSVVGKAPGQFTVAAGIVPDLYPRRVPDYSLSAQMLTVTITP